MSLSGSKLVNIRLSLNLGVVQFANLCNVCTRTLTRLMNGEGVHPATSKEVIRTLAKYDFVPIDLVEDLCREWIEEWGWSEYARELMESKELSLRDLILATRRLHIMNEPVDYKVMQELYDRPERMRQRRRRRKNRLDPTKGEGSKDFNSDLKSRLTDRHDEEDQNKLDPKKSDKPNKKPDQENETDK